MGHTGGFGEPTCHRCHFDQPRNDPEGRLEVDGFPRVFHPGETYAVRITLARPGMAGAGFQLAVRFSGGERVGEQAGLLFAGEERVDMVEGASGIQYVQQSPEGLPAPLEAAVRWTVGWRAPLEGGREVTLHVAANAANDDASELGDFVYFGEWRSCGPRAQ